MYTVAHFEAEQEDRQGVQAQTQAESLATRIVLVLPTYLPESFGGAEQQSRKLGLALSRQGVRVTLLAPRVSKRTSGSEQDGPLSLRRFHVRKPPNLGGRQILSLLSWSCKLIAWLVINRREYDVIHIVHGRLHALPAVLGGVLLRKPTLIKIGRGGVDHFDLDLVKRKRLLGRWYARIISQYTTGYIANSQAIVADLRRWQIETRRIYEIPNGVDLPSLNPKPAPIGTVQLVYLGRLDVEKRLDLMITGFARICEEFSATLTIAGDGSCRSELQELTTKLGVENRVRFAGVITDVSTLLREADIYVSCSVSEGMSNSLLEAMSFGVMPLVSLVSGANDIVTDESTGLLFASTDLEAFVSRLRAALSMTTNERRQLGLQARAAVEQRFGIDKVAQSHVCLYRELTAAVG